MTLGFSTFLLWFQFVGRGWGPRINCDGNLSLDETVEKIKINTRRLAKGQRTWFKTFKNVNWIDAAEDDTENDILQRTLALIDP